MRRVIVVALAGASLAGCSSFSFDSLKGAPPTVQVQLDSIPSGADAKTSAGPGCKTPCSVAVPVTDAGFTVTYTLNKFQPTTVQVQIINNPGEFAGETLTPGSIMVDPNPVVAELKPAGPLPKSARTPSNRPKASKPPKTTAAPAGSSPFPPPPR
jgi:hypothetical protein